MCALMCVRVCACARRCVRVRVCVGEGFRFAFLFAWVRACGCVRVCVCACGWGGVQGRRYFWARVHRLVSTYTPGTQRDKLFATPLYRTPRGVGCLPLPQPQGSLPHPFTTNPRLLYLPQGCLGVVCFSLGYLFFWLPYWVLWGGVGVDGGGVFFW
jgi:hypothetical protein